VRLFEVPCGDVDTVLRTAARRLKTCFSFAEASLRNKYLDCVDLIFVGILCVLHAFGGMPKEN
jgi:hypothetical protein